MLSRPKRGCIKFAGAVLCTMSSTADCALSVIGSPTCRHQECHRKSSDARIAANQSGWRKGGLPNGLKSVVSAQNATSAFLGDAKDGFHRKIHRLLARSWRQVI